MVDEGIPGFLRIPQDERKAAWDKARAERKTLPPEQKTYRPLTGADTDVEPDQS